ncbi:MAG: hypothetical protein NC390_01490 [Fusobacterium sp.]|nr:hypothetical protein [Fusobacterium sp.]
MNISYLKGTNYMIQAPSIQNPYHLQQQQYMQNPMYMQPQAPQADYNAVKIAINGASVQAPGAQQPQVGGYAAPTMPYYSYPQADLYNYPQAAQQPYYMPAQTMPCTCPICTAQSAQPQAVAPQPAPAPVAEQPVAQPAVQPQVIQQNFNAPSAVAVPEPVITQAVAQDVKSQEEVKAEDAKPAVEVEQPQELKPQVDINAFIAELTNPDYEKQASAMENIAMMVNQDPQKATELLDERVVKSLTDILSADTKELVGPSKEQMEARQKIMTGKEVSDAEKELANTMTPKEQAERNKSYALFTMAIMQKLFGDEVEKLSGQVVPITELPGAVSVVEQLKSNPNPMVRASAIESLSYIERPEYKEDLNTIFTIAKNDQDKNVQETATAALAKLNKA